MTTTPRPPDALVSGLRHRIADLRRLADLASPNAQIAAGTPGVLVRLHGAGPTPPWSTATEDAP